MDDVAAKCGKCRGGVRAFDSVGRNLDAEPMREGDDGARDRRLRCHVGIRSVRSVQKAGREGVMQLDPADLRDAPEMGQRGAGATELVQNQVHPECVEPGHRLEFRFRVTVRQGGFADLEGKACRGDVMALQSRANGVGEPRLAQGLAGKVHRDDARLPTGRATC